MNRSSITTNILQTYWESRHNVNMLETMTRRQQCWTAPKIHHHDLVPRNSLAYAVLSNSFRDHGSWRWTFLETLSTCFVPMVGAANYYKVTIFSVMWSLSVRGMVGWSHPRATMLRVSFSLANFGYNKCITSSKRNAVCHLRGWHKSTVNISIDIACFRSPTNRFL